MRRKIGTALFFGCACAQPRQINPFGQCSPVGKAQRCVPISRRLQLAAKAAHSSAVGFFRSVFAVVGVIETAHGLAILLDELTGVELGVDHHGVRRGVTEQRLNDVHRRVVVQMFGCKDAPAIVRQQHERRTVRAAGFRGRSRSRGCGCEWSECQRCWDGECPGSNTALEGEDASPAGPNDHKPGPTRCCRSVLRIG